MPLQTLINSYVGYLLCIVAFMGVYYGNIWRSQDFPFLSQLLYNQTSNSTYYVSYNQSLILNEKNEIDFKLLEKEGLPYIAGTYIVYILSSNMAMTASIVHMVLFNYDDVKTGWAFAHPSNIKKLFQRDTWVFWQWDDEEQKRQDLSNPDLDPHYKLMLKYKSVPQWWWLTILVLSFVVSMICVYALKSTLPWWGVIISMLLATVMILFFGAQYGLTGFQFNMQPIAQMLAGYMFPGRPLAYVSAFYFSCSDQCR